MDEHPPYFGGSLRRTRHAWGAKSPTPHSDGCVFQVADEERPTRRTEVSCSERSLIRRPIKLDVELLGCRLQQHNVGVLVRHLPDPKLLSHLHSVEDGLDG